MPVSIETKKEIGEFSQFVVSIEGSIDTGNFLEKKEKLMSEIEERKGPVIINMEKVTHIDSFGLSLFFSIQKALGQERGVLKLASVRPNVLHVFQVTKTEEVFEFYDTVDDALRSVNFRN